MIANRSGRQARAARIAATIAGWLTLAVAPALGAQGSYRVAIGVADAAQPIIAEFRVCVPAETSDCGSWIVNGADATETPAVITRLRSPNGADSISIYGDAVRIRSLGAAKSVIKLIREPGHTPRSVAVASDSQYAFVIFESTTGEPTLIDMIQLASMAVTDTLVIRGQAAGIAVVR